MDAKLADDIKEAAASGRRRAMGSPGSVSKDDLPWAVIEAFDARVRGQVERDRRIEHERDRVLIAAVNLAEMLPGDALDAVADARTRLVDAIDYLEQAVLRFGIVSRRPVKLR
ncbi:hypothetical protein G3T14_20900 [Methylobacterium sp. BTF04]|uniref:hypothetical protein n=1 Tax=Methylobacterium sp. BTF04 TaxID=2708300 RepID=UPI0013CF8FE8|nr:hypothetical protein [Methylobacterium sp. BTF04]NEU14556.1 hypothetical protein [Methylobacterium sp. BTF04]